MAEDLLAPMPMFRDFFLGFIKIRILYHAAEEPIYGLAMMQELERRGSELSPGTLYPILHGLEAEGLLEREERVVEGRVRPTTRDGRCRHGLPHHRPVRSGPGRGAPRTAGA